MLSFKSATVKLWWIVFVNFCPSLESETHLSPL